MKGKIFSIEEFSTFDGPGIRMSVFLKGCPLRCTWCHNPEGQHRESEFVRKNGNCLGCGACTEKAERLPDGGLRLTEKSARACPKGLIRLCGEDYSSEELCYRILKNAKILAMNGGGVTFSGGEPLVQHKFVEECMDILRSRVHCALQTCGCADTRTFKQILTKCDYVLYDLKLMDGDMHQAFCGTDNCKILENYRALAHSTVPFVTRVPLIPTVTDSEKNIRAIAEFMSGQGVSYAELLPYNKMAGGKYGGLLRAYTPNFDGSIDSLPRAEIFEEFGIKIRVL